MSTLQRAQYQRDCVCDSTTSKESHHSSGISASQYHPSSYCVRRWGSTVPTASAARIEDRSWHVCCRFGSGQLLALPVRHRVGERQFAQIVNLPTAPNLPSVPSFVASGAKVEGLVLHLMPLLVGFPPALARLRSPPPRCFLE